MLVLGFLYAACIGVLANAPLIRYKSGALVSPAAYADAPAAMLWPSFALLLVEGSIGLALSGAALLQASRPLRPRHWTATRREAAVLLASALCSAVSAFLRAETRASHCCRLG